MQPTETVKPWWHSKTVWLNAIGLVAIILTALLGTDLVNQNPQVVLWLAAGLAVANGVLRWFTTGSIAVAVLLFLSLSRPADAQVQLCSAQKLANLKASLPATVDTHWQDLFHDPATIYYTVGEMPPAYQLSITHGRAQYFHDARNNVSGDPSDAPLGDGRGGNANVVFPWRNPGGIDAAENEVFRFTFFRLPERDGGRWPVVYWHEDRSSVIAGPHSVLRWTFPIGTIFGEVLQLTDSTKQRHTFEVRIRIRKASAWAIEILRPYPTAGDLIAALDALGGAEAAAVAEKLRGTKQVAVHTLADANRTKRAFSAKATTEVLPPMSEALVKRLLDVPLRPSAGYHWRETDSHEPDAVAPTSEAKFGIVPRGYTGAFLGNDTESCANCHKTTLQAARSFDTPRGWYGFVRGSDDILSWNPVEPSCVSATGGDLPVVYRRAFVSAGMWAKYDRAQHPADRYTILR